MTLALVDQLWGSSRRRFSSKTGRTAFFYLLGGGFAILKFYCLDTWHHSLGRTNALKKTFSTSLLHLVSGGFQTSIWAHQIYIIHPFSWLKSAKSKNGEWPKMGSWALRILVRFPPKTSAFLSKFWDSCFKTSLWTFVFETLSFKKCEFLLRVHIIKTTTVCFQVTCCLNYVSTLSRLFILVKMRTFTVASFFFFVRQETHIESIQFQHS